MIFHLILKKTSLFTGWGSVKIDNNLFWETTVAWLSARFFVLDIENVFAFSLLQSSSLMFSEKGCLIENPLVC